MGIVVRSWNVAFLCETLNVPKPTSLTSSPLLRALVTVSRIVSTHLEASAFDNPADVETAAIKSFLFTFISLFELVAE